MFKYINKYCGCMLLQIKKCFSKILFYIKIIICLHSNSPTKEIKRNWEIFVIGGLPVVFLVLFSGEKILGFIQLPNLVFINSYGAWLFFGFVFIYVIVFFDYQKCKDITAKKYQKYDKS